MPRHQVEHGSRCEGPPALSEPLEFVDLALERELAEAMLASLPGEAPDLEDLALGERFVAASAGGRAGLASTLGATPPGGGRLDGLVGAPITRAADLLLEDDPFLRSVGLACLIAALPVPGTVREGDIADAARILALDRDVVIVGDFPFTEGLVEVARRVSLLELRPSARALPRAEWPAALERSEVALITSTALLTRSLASFVRAAPGALVLLAGPSTPLCPVLFERGALALGGSMVVDGPGVLKGVREGLPFHQLRKMGVERVIWWKEEANR